MEYCAEFVKNVDYGYFFDTYRRLQRVILYNAKSDDCLYQDSLSGNIIITVKRKICYADCGEIHPLRFIFNIPFFTESQHHNTCLNRKVCIDAEGNIYSQPAKCTYNPYICLWEGQEGYVPVEECGTYSRETGFVPDKKRIAELNKQIWGEE